jgi:hypothetical protein
MSIVQPGGIMQVVVPPGLGPGSAFAVQTPNGPMQVVVPHGLPYTAAGTQVMQIQIPAVAVQQSPPPMVFAQLAPMVQSPQPATPPQQVRTSAAATPGSTGGGGSKSGPSNMLIYSVDLTPGVFSNDECPLGRLPRATLPADLKAHTDLSDASWELTKEKLSEWQTQIGPCPIPCCQTCCLYTAGCCVCTPCILMQYSSRGEWEKRASNELDEMLKKYSVKVSFEKEGVCCCGTTYANFLWA